ncbi:MAG: LamG-like jellyroll fold domain-containing protein [Sedimentisphaeraceae bacterium JB056]
MNKHYIYVILLVLCCFAFNTANAQPEVIFKQLYNNDCTNIYTCDNPWGIAKTKENAPLLIRKTIEEAADAGVDAVMFAPGMGWVPWWPSTFYPDHYQWYLQRMQTEGLTPIMSPLDYYVYEGGDVVNDFLQACRDKGVGAFISYRVNDVHHLTENQRTYICKFYYDHPEYKIGTVISAHQVGHNWLYEEARNYKLAMITELCTNYDVDGIELDFLRFPSYFPDGETTYQQRSDIMVGFVQAVAAILDSTSKNGRQRYLSVRIPDRISDFDAIGIDVQRFVNAGVDMVNLSNYYWTNQQSDISDIRAMIPEIPLYHEFTNFIERNWQRETTLEQFYTSAYLAYQQGANGVSTFNFAYYRPTIEKSEPFHEPPFEIFNNLDDIEFLSTQNQWYFNCGGLVRNAYQQEFIASLESEQTENVEMRLALTDVQLQVQSPAILRLQTAPDTLGGQWEIKVNGNQLTETTSSEEPFDNSYTSGIGNENEYQGWLVPRSYLLNGDNQISLKLLSQSPVNINMLDIALPYPCTQASRPTPQDKQDGVAVNGQLAWLDALDALSYNVYLSNDRDQVVSASTTSECFYGNTSEVSFVYSDLRPDTDYFWRIDAVLDSGAVTGDVWEFTTDIDSDAMLLLDADLPGETPFYLWQALRGGDGELVSIGQSGYKPQYKYYAGHNAFLLDFDSGVGSQIAISEPDMRFDYDSKFSIEAWIRPTKSLLPVGRMHIAGSQLRDGTGYRLTARQYEDTFFIEFSMRDNIGVDTQKAKYEIRSTQRYPMGQWAHVAAVYDGSDNSVPSMKIFVNGMEQGLTDLRDSWVPAEGERDFIPEGINVTVGAKETESSASTDIERMWFGGDIGYVSIYSKVLSQDYISELFNKRVNQFDPLLCDFDFDGRCDYDDFVCLAFDYGINSSSAGFNDMIDMVENGIIDADDLKEFSKLWLSSN